MAVVPPLPTGASEAAAAGAVICGHKGAETPPLRSKQARGEAGRAAGGRQLHGERGGTVPVPVPGAGRGPPVCRVL